MRSVGVNSCVVRLASVDGAAITTTEGLGNSRDGYHPVQERVVGYNGSQCGFCTPGMVMAMYSLLSEKEAQGEDVLAEDIERRFDGNICRCTGYVKIIEAVQFAVDEIKANPNSKQEAA